MKHCIILLIMLCSGFFAGAQKIEEELAGKDIEVGINSLGDTITGTEIQLPYTILSYDIDSTTHELVLILRSNKSYGAAGYIALYDLEAGSLRWANEIPGHNFDFVIGKDRIIQNTENRTTCIDKHDGKTMWTKRGTIYFGDIAETRNINNKSIVLSTGGVYYLNLAKSFDDNKTGKSIDQNAAFAIANTAGVALGLLTGTFVSTAPTNYQEAIYDNHSNIFPENQYLYFASSNMLYKIDITDGKRIWETELPPQKTSNSTIHLYKDNLLFVNNGYALTANSGLRPVGEPYIASFNKSTGKLNYIQNFYNYKPITTSVIADNKLVAICGSYLYTCDLKTGRMLSEKNIRDLKMGVRRGRLLDPSKYYVKDEENYISMESFRPNTIFLKADNNSILCFNESIELEEILTTEVWEKYYSYQNTVFIRNKDKSLIIKDNKRQGSINISTAFIYGNTILDIDKNHIRIVEVDPFFTQLGKFEPKYSSLFNVL